jgi:hypothetical protein
MLKRSSAADLTFGCLAVGIFIVISAFVFQIVTRDYSAVNDVYARYQANAENEKSEIERKIGLTCTGKQPAAMLSCVHEYLDAFYERQSTKADLQAQLDMALWSKWMFISSIAGVAATLVGIFFVRVTFHEARETTSAAIAGVEEARKTNHITEKATRIEQRPWLSIEVQLTHGIKFVESGAVFALKAIITNHGQTPATNVAIDAIMMSGLGYHDVAKVQKIRTDLIELADKEHFLPAVVLPHQTIPKHLGKVLKFEDFVHVPLDGGLIPNIVLCVIYKSLETTEWFSTISVFDVFEKDGNSDLGKSIQPNQGSLATDQLNVFLSWNGSAT